MSFIQKVRQKIEAVVNQEQSVWNAFTQHSSAYMRVLELEPKDLEVLKREHGRGSMYPDLKETASKGFLQVTIGGKQFSLSVKNVCGAEYGGRWTESILAICTSDPSMNESVGSGTTLISVISEEWHERLVKRLENDDNHLRAVH